MARTPRASQEVVAPASPTSGHASRAFTVPYNGSLLSFAAGQRVQADAPLAQYLADHGLPITWEMPQ
ncbi:MAG: hypothetical protein NVS3B5_18940 [Sphingomicrobium sp.]